jgi:hypothetical protein
MKRSVLICGVLALVSSPALAADRLTDKDVKELVTRIEQGRDKFDDELDDKLKSSVVRGSSGEVKVDDFLNDFQQSIDRLEERMKPEYAGSAEAGAILRQATAIDAFFKQQPAGTRGESEWNRLVTDLKILAASFGTSFPLGPNPTVRRIGDRELAEAIEQFAEGADRMKGSLGNDLKKDTTVAQSSREAIVREADQLVKDAKDLKDKVEDGDPSSAEAERVLTRAATLHKFVGSHKVPTSAGIWSGLAGQLRTVASAYGRSSPGNQ